MLNFQEWLNENTNRYSVEINYRTPFSEVKDGYAKLTLGFISAAMKNHGFHVKQVLNEKPLRIFISTRNFDDGEWTAIISYNEKLGQFVISKGFYNKSTKTISVQSTKTLSGSSASDITKEAVSAMRQLEKLPIKPPMLKPLKRKTGPKG